MAQPTAVEWLENELHLDIIRKEIAYRLNNTKCII